MVREREREREELRLTERERGIEKMKEGILQRERE
jgi:hypothetical protein